MNNTRALVLLIPCWLVLIAIIGRLYLLSFYCIRLGVSKWKKCFAMTQKSNQSGRRVVAVCLGFICIGWTRISLHGDASTSGRACPVESGPTCGRLLLVASESLVPLLAVSECHHHFIHSYVGYAPIPLDWQSGWPVLCVASSV